MSNLRIEPVLCRAGTMDNYAWLLTDEETGQSAVVDPVSYTHLTLPTSDLV